MLLYGGCLQSMKMVVGLEVGRYEISVGVEDIVIPAAFLESKN